MRFSKFIYILSALAVLFTGCEGTTFKSSVPSRPVQLTVDTRAGIYVHFVRENIGASLVVDTAGYHFNKQTLPLTPADYIGYAGVVVYVDNYNQYSAFDLCCPHCINKHHPCQIDGCFAECPLCGEQYDLSFGYGLPIQGISKEALRKYRADYNGAKLYIHD